MHRLTSRQVSLLQLLVIALSLGLALSACQSASEPSSLADSALDEREDDIEAVGDLDAILADRPDPKTLPDELKADEVFPAQFDIVELQSPVKSQGSRGVCSIFSTIALMEHLYIKGGAVTPDFSEQFLQWSVKSELGRFKNTTGSNGSANISAISQFGVVSEEADPYEGFSWTTAQDERCDKESDKQPIACFTNGDPSEDALSAKRWKLPPSRWISSSRDNLKAFIHENQTGVVVGMTFFYQSWNHRKSKLPVNSEYSRQGYVLYPNAEDKEKSLEKRAGHSILIVGWDDELEVPIVDAEGNPVLDENGEQVTERGFFLFKNSWGTFKFGSANPHGAGYGWLSMRYVEEYGSAVSSRPPTEELSERCDDGLDNNFDGKTDCEDLACAESVSCQVAPTPDLSFMVEGDEAVEIVDQGEITETLELTESGSIDELTLEIEIEHSYSGDLEITLTSPSGTQLTIIEPDSERVEPNLTINVALDELRGEWSQGAWKLRIVDHFEQDQGQLKRWSLSGHLSATPLSESLAYSVAPRLAIPDNDAEGIKSKLNVEAMGRLEAATVWLKINHAYRGDLNIKLIHPSGAQVALFNREGRNSVDLELTEALPAFNGLEASGEWTLQVADLGAGDLGELIEWGVEVVVPAE